MKFKVLSKNKMNAFILALRIWFLTNLVMNTGYIALMIFYSFLSAWSILLFFAAGLVASIPALIIILITLNLSSAFVSSFQIQLRILWSTVIFISLGYGTILNLLLTIEFGQEPFLFFIPTALLISASVIAIKLSEKKLNFFFYHHSSKIKTKISMEQNSAFPEQSEPVHNNKILYKAIITGVLILVLMIPTLFISNLVTERKFRQEEVAREVSEKWASGQTLTGPYIYLPFNIIKIDKDKKSYTEEKHLIIIPDNLEVTGDVSHQIRTRSIYKVPLYTARLNNKGNYLINLPKDIDSSTIKWSEAKICYGLTDFKGIEQRLIINLNGADIELSPGLPVSDLNKKGLSASIPISASDLNQQLSFSIDLAIKGSEKLHFIPLSGDSRFDIRSSWPAPSFDGNNLPAERAVSDTGFEASWTFNKANLPFGTVLRDFEYDESSLAFGVSMVQPADGYSKTDRCIKYAILFIGLTFSLFFIIELFQKRALHPVQYVLVGLALVIFYTLLLSITEFLAFDLAYLIAAVATILLISSYAYGHFKRFSTAMIFGAILSLLYGFTFVLIRLEDTALLIGSIGLFIILAIAMYFSRKINWYGSTVQPSVV